MHYVHSKTLYKTVRLSGRIQIFSWKYTVCNFLRKSAVVNRTMQLTVQVETCTPMHCRWCYLWKGIRSIFELSTLADRREELMRRFFDQLKRPDSCLAHLMPAKRELSLINYSTTRTCNYTNFRKRELLNIQNLLFLYCVQHFYVNTERYLHLYCSLSFILSLIFNPAVGCNSR